MEELVGRLSGVGVRDITVRVDEGFFGRRMVRTLEHLSVFFFLPKVEQRIDELAQLSAGRTAVDDLDGNALLWSLTVVAHRTVHTLRAQCLSGSWRMAQPRRIRLLLLRLPAKLTTHGRRDYPQLLRDEPGRRRLLVALRVLRHGIPPPLPA